MPYQVQNEKGFLVLSCTQDELRILGMPGICDSCNHPGSKQGFYIAVLNWWVCPKCYESYLNRSERYPEDERIEKRNFENMKTRLNLILN